MVVAGMVDLAIVEVVGVVAMGNLCVTAPAIMSVLMVLDRPMARAAAATSGSLPFVSSRRQ